MTVHVASHFVPAGEPRFVSRIVPIRNLQARAACGKSAASRSDCTTCAITGPLNLHITTTSAAQRKLFFIGQLRE
jgi:hypothetical protein